MGRKIEIELGQTFQEIEKQVIIETLKEYNDSLLKTAYILKRDPRTIRTRLQEYGIRQKKPQPVK